MRTGLLEPYNPGHQPGRGGDAPRDRTSSTTSLDDAKVPLVRRRSGTRSPGPRATTSPAGEEVVGIDWFRENGFLLRPYSEDGVVPLSDPEGTGGSASSFPTRSGSSATARSSPTASTRWGSSGGTASSASTSPCRPGSRSPDIWINYAREVGRDPRGVPVLGLDGPQPCSTRGARTSGFPLINEVAGNIAGHRGVLMNRGGGARARGSRTAPRWIIESVVGETRGEGGPPGGGCARTRWS